MIYMDASKLFAECRRVLRKGGLLLINTPNKDQPNFQPSRLSREYHSVPELRALLLSHGFVPVFFGAFPASDKRAPGWSIGMASAKRLASRLATFVGLREPLRRLTGSAKARLTLKSELVEEEMRMVSTLEITALPPDAPDRRHRVIYVVCQAE